MSSKYAETAQFILEKVGGASNVTSLTHCATRLRFQLKDASKADQKALDANPNVMGVVPQGTTGLQVIMGGAVASYYKEIVALPGMGSNGSKPSGKKEYGGIRGKSSAVDFCFEYISDTFRPVLWALLGASLIITLMVLFDTFGINEFRAPIQPPTFQFMHAMWHSVFYFFPVFVGACAARKLGANEWVGAAIPAALMTPEYLTLASNFKTVVAGGAGAADLVAHGYKVVDFFGVKALDVFGLPMVLNDYGGQVFPPIIAAIALYWVEKGLKRIIPENIQMVFVPFFSLLVMIPATAFVFGPFGIFIGNGISNVLNAVNNFSPFILSILIPCLYPFLVPLGLHWPLNAIMVQNLETLHYDFIQGPMGAWNLACFGVITGVMIVSAREGNKSMRQIALGGMMAGLLGGISEPSLYGCLLRYRKSYLRLLPGCVLGGVVMGFFKVQAHAFVFTSLLTIPAMTPTAGYALGIAVAFFTSMFLVIFFDYRTKEEKAEALEAIAQEENAVAEDVAEHADKIIDGSECACVKGESVEVKSPLAGRVIALTEMPDPVFAGGTLGLGACIDPSGNEVVAPADGEIVVAFETGHAVGIKLNNGVELLVHVGIDTVELADKAFKLHVSQGEKVKAGQKLITFDADKIVAEGYSKLTAVLVTNTAEYKSVSELNVGSDANLDTPVIKVEA